MKFDVYTEEESKLLRELLVKQVPRSEIHKEFVRAHEASREGFVVLRTLDGIKRKAARCKARRSKARRPEPKTNNDQEIFDILKEIQSEYKERSVVRTVGLIPKEKIARKILSLSDIHFPFANVDYLNQAVNDHSDADIVVINGDLMDGYIFSTYEKEGKVAALKEYMAAFEFIKMLSERFPAVHLVNGNHDARISRRLKSMGFEKERSQILRPDLLARIQNGERLDENGRLVEKLDFSNVFYEQRESWYVKIGKTLFVHPWGKGSAKAGFTAQRVNDYFSTRYNPEEYDSVVVGHVHKCYKGVINSKLLIEQGCLSDLMGYSHSAQLSYINNGMNGYAVICQDAEGNTSFNHSGFIFLGEVLPPKKDALA